MRHALTGKTRDLDRHDPHWRERGVIDAINRQELYALYGGRDAYLRTPQREVALDLLVLRGKLLAQQDEAERMEDEAKQAGQGGGSGGGGGATGGRTTSSYTPRGTSSTGSGVRSMGGMGRFANDTSEGWE